MEIEKETRILRKIIIFYITLLAILFLTFFLIRVVFAGLVIPSDRHFIYKGQGFWASLIGKEKTEYVVTAEMSNSRDEPVEVAARCEVVTIDEDGRLVSLGKWLRVDPESATIYPKQRTKFKIYFPVEWDRSILAVFSTMPKRKPGDGGVSLTRGFGYVLATTFCRGDYEPEATLEAHKTDDKIGAVVFNLSKYVIEGFLTPYLKGEENGRKHFFIPGNSKRSFDFKGDGSDSIVLDVDGMPKRLGIRF